jgi:vitamin B12 transporter
VTALSRRHVLAATVSFCTLQAASAQAQDASPAPDIVITATRTPLAIAEAGSAISVISGEEIARTSAKSISDALRRVPGLTVAETGGPGSSTTVRIRGAESRHTLVLIDGVRVNDPSGANNEFDFASLVPTDIERIEVLRGPQSALYGSDAIGGVINVITKKGRGGPHVHVGTEAGSYGSKGVRAGVSGGTGPLSYAFSVTGYDTAGFSRYGYRIGRIERTRLWPLEADATKRLGASGRVSISVAPDVEVEVGGYASLNNAQYDAAWGDFPDTPSLEKKRLAEGYTRLTALAFDGLLRNTLLVSANRTTRDYKDISYAFGPSWRRDGYVGDRVAAEYQGDLKLGVFGLLTVGTRFERERLVTTSEPVLPVPGPSLETNDASQTTRSLFAIHQVSLWENLHLSLGGRIDDVEDGDRFGTWRATAAYEIPETGTKFRASIGTGAKAPTLFQQFDPIYGTPGLEAERSVGFDAGIDQRLFDDRLILSATVFANRFRDLIDFSFSPSDCPPANPFGCYLNIARARTSGIELAADVDVSDWLDLKFAYTHLEAFDEVTDKQLARRPADEARFGLVLKPTRDLSIEPTLVLVGSRYSSTGEQDKLAPYARLDVYADYRINDRVSLFARVENLTDAEYEEVFDYGTAGRSFYAGLRATW